MGRNVIISCAVTGAGDTVGKHPSIPVTPAEIATSAIEAARAGAAIVHIHVRDPETGAPSRELALYRDVVDRIRQSGVDVIINLTGGPGANYFPSNENPAVGGPGTTLSFPQERVRHIQELRPEICTLDIATLSMGERTMLNTPAHLRIMAGLVREAGVVPELEVFDTGHIRLAQRLVDEGVLGSPPMIQLCLGISYGAPATPEAMIMMRDMLPQPCVWAAFGIAMHQFPMVAQAVILGGHVRVGLEDNLYMERGVLPHAPSFLRAICSIPLFGITKVAANDCSPEIPTKMPTNRTAAVNFYACFQRATKIFLKIWNQTNDVSYCYY
jgi:uncharacterized protein (DUF849 family)